MLQAEDYVVCSESHPVSFVDPKVVFAFFNGVTSDMAAAFRKAKVVVLGNEVPVSPTVHEKLSQLNFDDSSDEDDDNDVYNEYKDNSVNSENSSSSPQYANKQSGEKTIQTQKREIGEIQINYTNRKIRFGTNNSGNTNRTNTSQKIRFGKPFSRSTNQKLNLTFQIGNLQTGTYNQNRKSENTNQINKN